MVFHVTVVHPVPVHPVPAETLLVLIWSLFAPAVPLLIGDPGVYDCQLEPPSTLDSYSSAGLTPPLPPLNVAETVPLTHTSATSGFLVIPCAAGCDMVFHVTVVHPVLVHPVPAETLLVLI